MIASFYFTLNRNGEDVDVLVEYEALKVFGDIDVDILSVTLDGVETETSSTEDNEILGACFDRLDEDWQADQDAYGDYLYEMRRDNEDC